MTDQVWVDADRAYDGSVRPPDRELTPRERDVICRVITDIFTELRRHVDASGVIRSDALDSLLFRDRRGGIRLDLSEVRLLTEVRRVLDPRGN